MRYLVYLLHREKEEMLGQFFRLQWNSPLKGDWVLQVRKDLADFGMSADPELLKKFSKFTFTKLVKCKAKEYAYFELTKRKLEHSKMANLSYNELEIQSYFSLPGIVISDVRTLFLFRTRMLDFHENYRGKSGTSDCPMCHSHEDSQDAISECKFVREKLNEYSSGYRKFIFHKCQERHHQDYSKGNDI